MPLYRTNVGIPGVGAGIRAGTGMGAGNRCRGAGDGTEYRGASAGGGTTGVGARYLRGDGVVSVTKFLLPDAWVTE